MKVERNLEIKALELAVSADARKIKYLRKRIENALDKLCAEFFILRLDVEVSTTLKRKEVA